MAMTKLKRFARMILRILRRLRDEFRMFRMATGDVLSYMVDRGIKIIQLKYDCLRVRKRMLSVRTNSEWESYARLLDHLEGTVDWRYIPDSDRYDYKRLEARRQMMKQLRNRGNVRTLSYCIRQDLVKNICNISDK